MLFGGDVFGGAVFAGTGQGIGAPEISGPTSFSIPESVTAGSPIATYTATGVGPIVFSLSGTDAAFLTIGASTGILALNSDPDFETKPSYSFNAVATNEGGSDSIAVSITVNNVTEEVITDVGDLVYTYPNGDAGVAKADSLITNWIAGFTSTGGPVANNLASIPDDPLTEVGAPYNVIFTADDALSVERSIILTQDVADSPVLSIIVPIGADGLDFLWLLDEPSNIVDVTGEFIVRVDGVPVGIFQAQMLYTTGGYIILDEAVYQGQEVSLTYTGTSIAAIDGGALLEPFENLHVPNNSEQLPPLVIIPPADATFNGNTITLIHNAAETRGYSELTYHNTDKVLANVIEVGYWAGIRKYGIQLRADDIVYCQLGDGLKRIKMLNAITGVDIT